jgi:hypothetical protein
MILVQDQEKARHWRYYLLLEAELARTLQVIEPDPANFGVFGLDLARQLVGFCSQFEVVAKLWSAQEAGKFPRGNIEEIRTALASFRPKYRDAKAVVMWRSEELVPFAAWEANKPPAWWTAYNKVKHDPARQLEGATLANVISAAAALLLVTEEYVGADNCIHGPGVLLADWPLP